MRIRETIYLDHQATTPVDSRVLAEMMPFFGGSFGNPHSVDHCLGWRAAEATERAAARIARLIGADADEIFFTSGATEANNLALLGIGKRSVEGKRRRILFSAIEHKSILTIGRVLGGQLGFQLERLPVNGEGVVDIAALSETLRDDVLVVSVMAVNNEIGTIQDIPQISRIVRSHGALFHCDAAQAPLALDLGNYAHLADLLSLSAHKFYGPQGIGALFIRRDLHDKIEPLVYGGGQQHGLRSGTLPVALCVGMGAAADLWHGYEAYNERESLRARRDSLAKRLTGLPWEIRLNGPAGLGRHPGNASMCFHGFCAQDILSSVQPFLAASTGSACSSGIPEPSHVLRSIGLSAQEAEASIRFSIGRGTTDQDIEDAAALIDDALARLARSDLLQSA